MSKRIGNWPDPMKLRHETFAEMVARQDEYYSRPEVIARLLAIPATHTLNRSTGKLTRVS